MSIETEVKIEIEDPEDFCRRLHGLGAVPVSSRHFEDNHLLDFPDHRLGSNRCLLRIRFAGKQAYLTYKGPPRPEGIFKTREELEISLEDNATSLQIFERIGMLVDFRYQKHRREFVLDDVNFVQAVAEITGMAIEMARLNRGLKNSIEVLKTMRVREKV